MSFSTSTPLQNNTITMQLDDAPTMKNTGLTIPIPKRVLYVIDETASTSRNFYAANTKQFVNLLLSNGYEVICLSQRQITQQGRVPLKPLNVQEVVDGVTYLNIPSINDSNLEIEFHTEKSYLKLLSILRPSFVIAGGNDNACIALTQAASQLNLPVFYEISELCHNAQSPHLTLESALKAKSEIAKKATHVITRHKHILDEITAVGVAKNNVSLIPTSIESFQRKKLETDEGKSKSGLKNNGLVIGYFLSDTKPPHLDHLLERLSRLQKAGIAIELRIFIDESSIGEELVKRFSNNNSILVINKNFFELDKSNFHSLNSAIFADEAIEYKRLVQATRVELISNLGIAILVSSDLEPNVNDRLDNVQFYKNEEFLDSLEKTLPYLNASQYCDLSKPAYNNFHGRKDLGILESMLLDKSKLCKSQCLVDGLSNVKTTEDELRWREYIDSLIFDGKLNESLFYSKALYVAKPSVFNLKRYIKSLFNTQKFKKILELCDGKVDLGHEIEALRTKSESYLKLFDLYFKHCQHSNFVSEEAKFGKKSVCFLHSSLPYLSGGYATRAHGLLTSLSDKGLDIKAYTRPNFPYDIKKDRGDNSSTVLVDDITYHKTTSSSVRHRDEATYMLECVDVFDDVIKTERPDFVHGRSTYQISFPALIAAKKNNLPFVYEVSGLWEIVHESRDSAPQRKGETEKIRNLETLTAKMADIVFTLTKGMKEELIARGVDENKITILPNCTNTEKFVPQEKSERLLKELNIRSDTPIIGYIGSFQDYEGLDDLVEACELLSERAPNLDYRLVLVGDGPYFKEIEELVSRSKVCDKIVLTGRVPHSEAAEYYSIVDVAPFPRKPWPVCEMVSPMKPLEALAVEKAVMVSSVSALEEMVINGETGIVFEKGDVTDMADKLKFLLSNKQERLRIGSNARKWASANRNWENISEIFLSATRRGKKRIDSSSK